MHFGIKINQIRINYFFKLKDIASFLCIVNSSSTFKNDLNSSNNAPIKFSLSLRVIEVLRERIEFMTGYLQKQKFLCMRR